MKAFAKATQEENFVSKGQDRLPAFRKHHSNIRYGSPEFQDLKFCPEITCNLAKATLNRAEVLGVRGGSPA